MPIDSLSGLNVAMSQFYALAVAKGVDEELRNQVLTISSSPIMAEASSQFCELVYARQPRTTCFSNCTWTSAA